MSIRSILETVAGGEFKLSSCRDELNVARHSPFAK